MTSPKIGISSCLLGQPVRFDGGHKRDAFITGPLAEFVEYVPVCPEAEAGMGIPRPPIRLVGDPLQPRAVGTDNSERDFTERLQTIAERRLPDLLDLCGYILKKDSPSCGMERVKVYPLTHKGPAERKGSGIYAARLQQTFPWLPMEEEGRLNDPVLRENFVNRVYVQHRWRKMRAEGLTAASLLAFHTEHKYMLMAHSQAAYQRMGRLLSKLSGVDLERVADEYHQELMTALKRRVNRKRHVNVLSHFLGYLKKRIDAADKAELVTRIEAYRREEVPLVVPVTLLRDYFRRYPDDYISRQYYLAPYPEKLGLRNAI